MESGKNALAISEEDIQTFRTVSPFSVLGEKDIEAVLLTAETKEFGTGDRVAGGGVSPGGLCVVMKGVLVAENRADKRIIALNAFMRGDIYGAAGLFAGKGKKYGSLVVAKRHSRIVVVPEETVRRLILENPDFALAFTAWLTGKIRFLNKKLTGYTSKSSVRHLLQYLEVACAENDDGTAKINISSVAEELNISRTTVYAGLDTLEQAGFIARDGKYCTLLRV